MAKKQRREEQEGDAREQLQQPWKAPRKEAAKAAKGCSLPSSALKHGAQWCASGGLVFVAAPGRDWNFFLCPDALSPVLGM